jgi:membrane protein implicated in regulation of membrane protease activity
LKFLSLLAVLLLGAYFVWLHSLNPRPVFLPLLGSLPPAAALLAALLFGFVAAWLLALPRLWRLGREHNRLRLKLKAYEAEGELEPVRPADPAEPVIPDRGDFAYLSRSQTSS